MEHTELFRSRCPIRGGGTESCSDVDVDNMSISLHDIAISDRAPLVRVRVTHLADTGSTVSSQPRCCSAFPAFTVTCLLT